MPDKVVDASAIAALLFGEPEGELVATQLANCRLLAPELLKYEIGNICWKKIKRHPEQRDALAKAFELFGRMRIEYFSVNTSQTLDIANSTNLTFYDAAYMWLAAKHNAALVRFDKELLRHARSPV